MPKQPRNLSRSFNNRYSGIFKKAAELHIIDSSIRISIIIEKPGITPLVFLTEAGHNWPPHIRDYVETRGPMLRRPTHYQSINDGISQGKLRIVKSSSTVPSPPSQGEACREQTPDIFAMEETNDMYGYSPSYGSKEGLSLPATPPRMVASRFSSPLPMNPVLPSKLQ